MMVGRETSIQTNKQTHTMGPNLDNKSIINWTISQKEIRTLRVPTHYYVQGTTSSDPEITKFVRICGVSFVNTPLPPKKHTHMGLE